MEQGKDYSLLHRNNFFKSGFRFLLLPSAENSPVEEETGVQADCCDCI